MKKIILDTDFGIDCDDAVALAMLINLQKKGECRIAAVTLSTSRKGAAAGVRAIFEYYGAQPPEIGKYGGSPLPADRKNVYSEYLAEKFGCDDASEDATEVLKKCLMETEGKILLVVIGPQCNLSALLRSEGGISLAEEKIEAVYIMGGCFDGMISEEFNIRQDVFSARYVADNCPVDTIYVPFEAGFDVLTGKNTLNDKNNPVGDAVRLLFATEFPDVSAENMERSSWDPIAALIAVRGAERYFGLSEIGKADFSASSAGKFLFSSDGNARYVLHGKKENLKKDIDELTER